MTKEIESDVFISYSREDQNFANKLKLSLEQEGLNVWWDEDLIAGTRFSKVIEEVISKTSCVIVLWSSNSINSNWVISEASEAMIRKKLVPVLIEDINPPIQFRQIHSVNLVNWNFSSTENKYQKLIQSISVYIQNSSFISSIKTKYPQQSSSPAARRRYRPVLLISVTIFLLIILSWFAYKFYFKSFTNINCNNESTYIQSGPMLGHVSKSEVLIWSQFKDSCVSHVQYWIEDKPEEIKNSTKQNALLSDGYAVKFRLSELNPGIKYKYRIIINNCDQINDSVYSFETQKLWEWRTDPPEFKFAMGSSVYINDSLTDRPGLPYGGDYHIFKSIQNKEPDFMLWLGNNVFFREVDFDSRKQMIKRYSLARKVPALNQLLSKTSNYAIWNDHDYGSNNSNRSFLRKNESYDVFKLFWANPNFGASTVNQGITTSFKWSDCDFFLLDNRFFRSPKKSNTTGQTILGKDQLQWLKDNLHTSQAPLKFVCFGGQVLSSLQEYEYYINIAPKERLELLDFIDNEKIRGVIFLTGDAHFSGLSRFNGTNVVIHEITASPLTAGGRHESNPNDIYRLPESNVYERNFAMIQVKGSDRNRYIEVIFYDANGIEAWSKTINQEDL